MTKKVDDAELITALLSSATRAQAAEKVGVTTRTIYNRLKDKDFSNKLETAKKERAERMSDLMDTATVLALEKLVNILSVDTDKGLSFIDNGVTKELQVSAARIVLQGCGKQRLSNLSDSEERL